MIYTENIIINGKDYIRTWSDKSVMIERDSCLYEEAIDPVNLNRTYIETNQRIEVTEEVEACYCC